MSGAVCSCREFLHLAIHTIPHQTHGQQHLWHFLQICSVSPEFLAGAPHRRLVTHSPRSAAQVSGPASPTSYAFLGCRSPAARCSSRSSRSSGSRMTRGRSSSSSRHSSLGPGGRPSLEVEEDPSLATSSALPASGFSHPGLQKVTRPHVKSALVKSHPACEKSPFYVKTQCKRSTEVACQNCSTSRIHCPCAQKN